MRDDGETKGLGRVGVFTLGLARLPHLGAFLDAERVVFWPARRGAVDTLVGWGRKPTARRPRARAEAWGLPFVALEDGFLRSVGLGVERDPPLSIVVDPVGIYYDATRPSALEQALAHAGPADPLADPALLARARRAIARIREAKLSKYNAAPDVSLGPRTRERVLVVDQTAGDLSIRLGLPKAGGFDGMLAAALREHPDAEIVVKTHPDVLTRAKRGNLTALAGSERLRLLTGPCNPASLLDEVDRVYVMTSLLGFEALLARKPVTCFGVPFYAGWGLTDDRAEVPARRARARSVEQVFAAAYLSYARYVDPETGERCEAERVIEHLALQREVGARSPARSVSIGFSAWKRGFLPSFLAGPGCTTRFSDDAEAASELVDDKATIVVWGAEPKPAVRALAERRGAAIWRMEDGFLRSVGLGSDLFAPASLVLDPLGIYYDPRTESELERILQRETFTPEELARARAVRELIVRSRISKYNVGAKRHVGPPPGDARRVVLTVGQVEDDASIRLGCVDVRRNEDLVRAARAARPHAYLVYKPHPDVVSGNRKDSLPLHVARLLCDEVVVDATLPDCLAAAHEVHTMTSLVGFEALLRELEVVAYGQPFYAGWGLTQDLHPHPRRTRRLSLDELVAGTLLRYPRYVHPRTGRYTTPEAIVAYLKSAPRPARWETTWGGRQVRKGLNLARDVLRGL